MTGPLDRLQSPGFFNAWSPWGDRGTAVNVAVRQGDLFSRVAVNTQGAERVRVRVGVDGLPGAVPPASRIAVNISLPAPYVPPPPPPPPQTVTRVVNEPFSSAVGMGSDGLWTPPAGTTELAVNSSFNGGDAGYKNSLGYYIVDANGKIVGGKVLQNDAQQTGSRSETIPLAAGQKIGYFLIADGARRGVQGGAAVTGVDGNAGALQVAGVGVVDAFFTERSRNADGLDHARSSGGSLNWEDLRGGGDQDFNDALTTVGVTARGSTQRTVTETLGPAPDQAQPSQTAAQLMQLVKMLQVMMSMIKQLTLQSGRTQPQDEGWMSAMRSGLVSAS